MTIGSSIKKGFSTLTHSKDLVGVLFVFGLIWNVVSVMVQPATPQPGQGPNLVEAILGFVFLFMSIFVQAGSFGYLVSRMKTGQANISAFMNGGSKYYLRFLMLGVIVSAIVIVLGTVAVLTSVFLGNILNVAGIMVGVVIGAFGIYFLMLMFFAPYRIVAENETALTAIKGSMRLIRQNLIGFMLITLFVFVLGFAVGSIMAMLAMPFMSAGQPDLSARLILAAVGSLLNAFLSVMVTSTYLAFYLGLNSGQSVEAQA